MEDKKTVFQMLEAVCNRFCDDYCKHSEAMNKCMDEAESDAMIEKLCSECPLNDIV